MWQPSHQIMWIGLSQIKECIVTTRPQSILIRPIHANCIKPSTQFVPIQHRISDGVTTTGIAGFPFSSRRHDDQNNYSRVSAQIGVIDTLSFDQIAL